MKKAPPSSGGGDRSIGHPVDKAVPGAGPMFKPFYQDRNVTLYCGDCRAIVPQLTDTVDLLLTDPPYSQVREEAWDRLNQSGLCRLLDEVFQAVRPKLAHNGAIYVFAWPRSAGIIEHLMSRHFNALNHIVWNKQDANGRKNGTVNRQHLPALRNYFPETERILFAEMYDADKRFQRESKASKEVVFRPLIEYFRNARDASGLSGDEIREKMFALTGKKFALERHAFSFSQWEFPAKDQFLAAATFLPFGDHGAALENYEAAKAKYEELRRQWENLRRRHCANKRNFTDLWNYRTLGSTSKERFHPCQKPLDMLCDMIETSCRPSGLVLDCFAGSGQTAIAACQTGRRAILIEQDAEMCRKIARRLDK